MAWFFWLTWEHVRVCRFMPLRAAANSADAFCEHVNQVVYNTLVAPTVSQLQGAAALPQWRQPDPEGHIPSFNAYPLPHVTVVGEYLMTLPQQLEVLMTEESEEAADDDTAAAWLDKVVTGVAALYLEQVSRHVQSGCLV